MGRHYSRVELYIEKLLNDGWWGNASVAAAHMDSSLELDFDFTFFASRSNPPINIKTERLK